MIDLKALQERVLSRYAYPYWVETEYAVKHYLRVKPCDNPDFVKHLLLLDVWSQISQTCNQFSPARFVAQVLAARPVVCIAPRFILTERVRFTLPFLVQGIADGDYRHDRVWVNWNASRFSIGIYNYPIQFAPFLQSHDYSHFAEMDSMDLL